MTTAREMPMRRTVLWAKMKRTDFAEALTGDAVVVVPVGAMEQHGEHLPVDTDATIGFELARHAALAIEDFPVLVLPPVWTGYSPHHMAFPGTVTLDFRTLVDVLGQIAVSIARHGFRHILFLNSHGGNKAMIIGLRTQMQAEAGIDVFGVNYWEIPGAAAAMRRHCVADNGRLGHSGEMETSLLLHLEPDRVDAGRARWVEGTSGDAGAGSATKGGPLFAALVDVLAAHIAAIRNGDLRRDLEGRRSMG